MTLQQLVTLASTTLSQVPHHPAITAELCAAICWHKSTGDPLAKGDFDMKRQKHLAVGLAQFHLRTWDRFALIPCSAHKRPPCKAMRTCADCSMIALVRELSFAARSTRIRKSSTANIRDGVAHYHNSGSDTPKRTAYVLRVKRTMKQLTPASSAKRPKSQISNLKSGGRAD